MNKALTSLVALAAVLIGFIALNIVSTAMLRGARIDLTSGRLYSLSPGTRNIARSLEEPVRLTLYFSEKPADDLPQFKNHGRRVKEMLREYASASGGKIRFEVVDPEPFSKEEDDASAAGLVGVPTGRGAETLYFGLVGAGAADDRQVIAFFDPSKEEFLEYDLSRLVYLLSSPKKKTVGLMSWLPLDGGQPNPMMRQMPQPWQIHAQIAEYFDLRSVPTDAREIPSELDVLMVVHPKRVSERTQYAIDQFVLAGGRAIVFVDPLCDADVPPGVNPMQAMGIPKDSDLPRLLPAWGLELVPESLAADNQTAVRVNAGSQNSPRSVAYPIWMNAGSATGNLDPTDPVTGTLRSMLIPTAGVLRELPVEGLVVQPLIRTTGESMMVPVASVSFMPDPEKILRDFVATGDRMILAARVTGRARSAFPGGPPSEDHAAEGVGDAEPFEDPGGAIRTAEQSSGPRAGAPAAHLAESAGDISVVVVADCDLLTDRFWITEDRFLGQIVMGYRKFADNGDFVIGALDQLSGSSDLIGLRARGTSARPFELVNRIRREAEQQFLQKSDELQQRLRQTEAKISELQRQRGAEDAMSFILSPEQQAELDRFNKERAQIRAELREVRHQLSRDIEGLGARLKFINIAVMPAVVALVAVGLGVFRGRRRAADLRRVADRT